jgi:hypothetical protein
VRGIDVLERIEETAVWLKKLNGETRAEVEKELERQKRALNKYIDGHMPRRTAKRIIERSHKRVAFIVCKGGIS